MKRFDKERYRNDPEYRAAWLARQRDYWQQRNAKGQPRSLTETAARKANRARRVPAKVKRNRDHVWAYKASHPCVHCGEDNPACLDFHHRTENDKTRTIAEMLAGPRSLVTLQKEIDKCDILCANCHRKFHSHTHSAPDASAPRNTRLRVRNAAYVAAYKAEHPCIKCGESYPDALDFHHREPAQKTRAVWTMRNSTFSIARIQTEIDKCVVLCANCHRNLHWAAKHHSDDTQ